MFLIKKFKNFDSKLIVSFVSALFSIALSLGYHSFSSANCYNITVQAQTSLLVFVQITVDSTVFNCGGAGDTYIVGFVPNNGQTVVTVGATLVGGSGNTQPIKYTGSIPTSGLTAAQLLTNLQTYAQYPNGTSAPTYITVVADSGNGSSPSIITTTLSTGWPIIIDEAKSSFLSSFYDLFF